MILLISYKNLKDKMMGLSSKNKIDPSFLEETTRFASNNMPALILKLATEMTTYCRHNLSQYACLWVLLDGDKIVTTSSYHDTARKVEKYKV